MAILYTFIIWLIGTVILYISGGNEGGAMGGVIPVIFIIFWTIICLLAAVVGGFF